MALTTVSNNALSNITAIPASIPTGALTLIKSITASASASISFVDGTDGVVLDDTYKSYIFKFIDIHPATDNVYLSFQGNAVGGSGFNETITSSFFRAGHAENDGDAFLSYDVSNDQAQGTSFQHITRNIGNGNDECAVGTLQIFAPSDTTFVKHFIATTQIYYSGDYSYETFIAGYINTTSAIDEIQFKMDSGNIDSGIIKLYGVL